MSSIFKIYLVIVMFLFSAIMLVGCIARSPERPASGSTPTSSLSKTQTQPESKSPGGETGPTFPTSGWKTDFSRHTVPYSEIISGGVPRDGIPPVYNPKFETVREADSKLIDEEPVAVLEPGAEARAYPLRILIWHEIVNDTIGDIPVAVTYCPLCNTVVVFDRRFEGQILTFGVSGLLRHSDLVMWDHQTESLWQQGTGEGIVGNYAGKLLDLLPSSLISWKDFKTAFPEGLVLSHDTGFRRNYGMNPYSGYDSSPKPFLFEGKIDTRLSAMERVVGLKSGDKAIAYPFSVLAKVGVVNDTANGQRIVIFYQSGTVSALDEASIAKSREVGAAAVFLSDLDGKKLQFQIIEGVITDRETGSKWNISGQATSGPLSGKRLKPVVHGTHFWFAWAAFNPQTRVFSP